MADRQEAASAERPPPARERVFRAARELFYARGIRAVGVDEIVGEAGVTKPSLYRSFPSKDDLVVACQADSDRRFWAWWDRQAARHPGDPKAQLAALFGALVVKTTSDQYRGCPMTNAAVEFPEPDHPNRRIAEANKAKLRQRLRALARELGVADADGLGDGLTLLMEGAFCTGQMFGPDGPQAAVARAAAALVAAHLAPASPA